LYYFDDVRTPFSSVPTYISPVFPQPPSHTARHRLASSHDSAVPSCGLWSPHSSQQNRRNVSLPDKAPLPCVPWKATRPSSAAPILYCCCRGPFLLGLRLIVGFPPSLPSPSTTLCLPFLNFCGRGFGFCRPRPSFLNACFR